MLILGLYHRTQHFQKSNEPLPLKKRDLTQRFREVSFSKSPAREKSTKGRLFYANVSRVYIESQLENGRREIHPPLREF